MPKSAEAVKGMVRELHACLPLVSLNPKCLSNEAVLPLLSNHRGPHGQ